MPGTVLSSFSVAVLMSILPSVGLPLVGGALVSVVLLALGIGELGVGVTRIVCAVKGVARDVGFSPRMKKVKPEDFSARTFSRLRLMPQPPIFCCLASSSIVEVSVAPPAIFGTLEGLLWHRESGRARCEPTARRDRLPLSAQTHKPARFYCGPSRPTCG